MRRNKIGEIYCHTADRWADAREIWDQDATQYPQGHVQQGWRTTLHRIKASICILLDWKGRDAFDVVPVWISGMYVGHDWNGPTCDWTEVGTPYGWRGWYFVRYRNGI